MLTSQLKELAAETNIKLADDIIDDVLTYALFPQVGLKFLRHRGDPDAFEPVPVGTAQPTQPVAQGAPAGPVLYNVRVNGKTYSVEVSEGGSIGGVHAEPPAAASDNGEAVSAALAGNIFRVLVAPGDRVTEGQTILIVEAMKMETEVSAPREGTIAEVLVREGDAVAVGDVLLTIS